MKLLLLTGCDAPNREAEPLCAECGHLISLHTHPRYGCEFEPGDQWVEGDNCGATMAQAPCGCTAVTVEASDGH